MLDIRQLYQFTTDYWNKIVKELTSSLARTYPLDKKFGMTSGRTAQSIGEFNKTPITVRDLDIYITIYMPPYYDYMDKGVGGAVNNTGRSKYKYKDKGKGPKGGQKGMPPISAMRKLMLNSGTVGKNYRKIRAMKPSKARSNTIDKELNSIAYAIAHKIWRDGIRGTEWYSSVINDPKLAEFERQVLEEYGAMVIEILTDGNQV